jgi:hypothetical protein
VPAGEAWWLPEDRWWALALAEVEADTCRDCGHPLHESTSADSEYAYEADVVRCHACATAAKRVTAHQDQGGSTAGLQVSVSRRR